MPRARTYADVYLELRGLDADADVFTVAVSPSPTVGETAAVQVPYRIADLEEALDDLEEKAIGHEDLIDLGERLADRLLPAGPVRTLFEGAVKGAGPDGGVRLRLVIHDPRLAQLPWEFTYLPLHAGDRGRNHFLVLNPQVSLVRHVPLDRGHPSLAASHPGRLRLVAASANPAGFERLSLKREMKVVQRALRDLDVDGVTVEWEPWVGEATPSELTAALQAKADLFHFAGHGEFQEEDRDPQTGEPVGEGSIVLLADKTSREPVWLRAGDLALRLQQAGVRLAVLGACESGRQDGVSAWTGVAPALIGRGLPAVVAMQYEVIDDHAVAFSEMFYAALAGGLSVDEAVASGRLAMLGISGDDDVEWGVPVLYMRAVDGVIFPKPAGQPSTTADQIRRVVRQTVDTIEKGGQVFGIRAKRARGSFEVIQNVQVVKGLLVGLEEDEL